MKIVSEPYYLTRTELARIASEEYIRNFWWFVAAVPGFGIVSLIFGSGLMQMIGMFAVLWPFSIPARSVLTTAKSSRLFTRGCHVEATEEELTFIGEPKDGKRLRTKIEAWRLKEVIQRRDMLLVRTRLPGFLPIRTEAFATEEDRLAFMKLVETVVANRLSDGESENPKDQSA